MATDIKLDQGDGNWLIAESRYFKSTAIDLMLDSPERRSKAGTSPLRRALVHDFSDGLTINWGSDYPGGVTLNGGVTMTSGATVTGTLTVKQDLTVNGKLRVDGKDVGHALADLPSLNYGLAAVIARLSQLENNMDYVMERLGAVVIPKWATKEEVEKGDDMGMSVRSAAELGLVVNFTIDQNNPNFSHEQVISITPPAGTPVLRGSTVTVEINLVGSV